MPDQALVWPNTPVSDPDLAWLRDNQDTPVPGPTAADVLAALKPLPEGVRDALLQECGIYEIHGDLCIYDDSWGLVAQDPASVADRLLGKIRRRMDPHGDPIGLLRHAVYAYTTAILADSEARRLFDQPVNKDKP